MEANPCLAMVSLSKPTVTTVCLLRNLVTGLLDNVCLNNSH